MRGRSRSCLRSLAVCFLLSLCVITGLAALFLVRFPVAAEPLGPASPALDPVARILLGAYLVVNRPSLEGPAGDPLRTLDLEVNQGATAGEVADQLQAAGIVDRGDLLVMYLRYRGMDVSIEAGRYLVSGDMSIRQIADALQSARASEIAVTIPEGWRREQIAELFTPVGTPLTPEDFLAQTSSQPLGFSFSEAVPEAKTMEGFLFPDTYHLLPTSDAGQLVAEMLQNLDRQMSQEIRQGFADQGLTIYQGLTLASIVEREAVVPEERPLIAAVFLNRLAQGMNLEADPTVQYAAGKQPDGSWWKSPLSLDDLNIDSPFNTYRYPGLPPSPIANPGLSSLAAVAFPADVSYLYFRATCDGSGQHNFALTFEEHLGNACP